MKKKLQNMERLLQKMHARFGEEDALVVEFRAELSKLQEERRKNLIAKNFGRRKVDTVDAAVLMN